MSHMGKGLAWTEVGAFITHACRVHNRPRGGRRGAKTLWASDKSTSGRHAAARFAPVAKSAKESNRDRYAPAYTVMEITKITCIDLKFHRCSSVTGWTPLPIEKQRLRLAILHVADSLP